MNVPVFSRYLFSVARRLPFEIEKLYVPALGQVINRPGDACSIFHEIYVGRIYEPIAPLPNAPTVVDLGSNIGLFTIFMNQRIKNGRILAFEASPPAFAYLERNIARVSRKNNNEIQLFNVAICDYAGELEFMIDKANATNVAAGAFRAASHYADFTPIRIPCDTIDHFVKDRIDLLKCDIEGAEYRVLTDDLLDPARVGQLMVEFHEIEDHAGEFERIMQTAARRGYAVCDQKNAPLPPLPDFLRLARQSKSTNAKLKFCAKSLLN